MIEMFAKIEINPKKLPTARYICSVLIKKFDFQKVGHGHGVVQLSHLRHSMENVKIYKCPSTIFAIAHAVSDI